MTLIEILNAKEVYYRNQGNERQADMTKAQIMAMRRAWTHAHHKQMEKAKEQAVGEGNS